MRLVYEERDRRVPEVREDKIDSHTGPGGFTDAFFYRTVNSEPCTIAVVCFPRKRLFRARR